MPILTHLFSTWHCQPPSLKISHHCPPWHCLPRIGTVLCLALAFSGSSPSSWQEEWDKERNGGDRKAFQARGKHGRGAVESGFRRTLRGWLKCNRQVGKAGRSSWDREIFSPHLAESSLLPTSFLSPPPLPKPSPHHLISAPS